MEFDIQKEREKWTLSEEDFKKNANQIFGELSLLAKKEVMPKFILIGGQAGAGKSGLVSGKYFELKGNAIIIDQDELRTKYPKEAYKQICNNYTERQEFLILNPYIAKLIQAIISKAKERGYNIILETALQDVEAFIENAKDLRQNGYQTELSVMAVSEVEGNISMLTRYCYYLEKDGECRRNTRINSNAIPNLKKNLKKLDKLNIFDDINIYVRGRQTKELAIKIYSQRENKSENPVQAFERGKCISFENTKLTFLNRYEEIKSVLEKHEDKIQLEKLETIKEQFIREIEMEIE
ncbi:MAG: hypothetical protein HFJ48_05115 [Clostridia bacterium]|nr:hypothetical protein [Clostridia bacterium]